MESLLIGGAPSVGKSQALYRLTERLLKSGFKVVTGEFPPIFDDFTIIIEKESTHSKTRIIINSPSDNQNLIHSFKSFYDKHKGNNGYNILVSSVRDPYFYPRLEFFQIMELSEEECFELPLAKITRQSNKENVLAWYEDKIDRLIDLVLKSEPFNINLSE